MKFKLLVICLISVLLFIVFHKVLAQTTPTIAPTAPIIVQATSTPEFERIAQCESGHNLHAKNPKGSASGEFQFVSASWYHYGREFWGEEFYSKNIWSTDNRELAWYVYQKYGTKDWNASKWCWAK